MDDLPAEPDLPSTWTNVSFDDEDESDLQVFSGHDLLMAHYDKVDLDWEEVAQRSVLDERRGLVIAQVAVLEDLVDEFILYLADPEDQREYEAQLRRQTIGPRLDTFEELLAETPVRSTGLEHVKELRSVASRRNELAHGTLFVNPVTWPLPRPGSGSLVLEWRLFDRRTQTSERVTMAGLRVDLEEAAGVFLGLLAFAEELVERVPVPMNFGGGVFLAA